MYILRSLTLKQYTHLIPSLLGVPLTDTDRLPWLNKLHGIISDCIQHKKRVIIACSALKYSYRQLLINDIHTNESNTIQFILLTGSKSMLEERIKQRHGHYMKAGMLQSQLDTLEEPRRDENIISVDTAPSVDEVMDTIKSHILSCKNRKL